MVIQQYNDNVFYGCSSLTRIVIPASITNTTNLNANMLNGSSVKHIIFKGISSIDVVKPKILSTQCFGLKNDCLIQLNNNIIMYKYVLRSQTIVEYNRDIFNYGQRSLTEKQINSGTDGKFAKFSVNQLYKYNVSLVDKFVPYTVSNGKPPLPLCIFFIDSKTSVMTAEFVETCLKDSNFKKSLREINNTPNCLYLVLDRGDPLGDALSHFNKKFGTYIKSFPSIIMYYKGVIHSASFQGLF